jgi:hypothetical protein
VVFTQMPLQHSGSSKQDSSTPRQTHWPLLSQMPVQHSSSKVQVLVSRQPEQVPSSQKKASLQHSLSAVQPSPPSGMQIGVVDVEVVLLVVVVVEARHLSVEAQLPRQSQRWFLRWNWTRSGLRQRVSALRRRHLPSSKGMWQILTQSSSSPARAREGISAARAVPAKSLSARRRLMEPSASALASSSKDWLVVCWLTCCPHSPKGGTMGNSPAQLYNEDKYEGLQTLAQLPRIP